MNCTKLIKHLDTFLDGELSADITVKVQSHLDECDECRAVALVKNQMKSAIYALGDVKVPEKLALKINKSFDSSHNFFKTHGIKIALPLAAGVLLAVAAGLWGTYSFNKKDLNFNNMNTMVGDVVRHHYKDIPMEIHASEPDKAASWFRGKVDFPVRSNSLSIKNASLKGARLSNVRDRQAAHMVYDLDGEQVMLTIFSSSPKMVTGTKKVTINKRDIFLGRKNGYNVAIWLDRDMAYAFSSGIPMNRLTEVVSNFMR